VFHLTLFSLLAALTLGCWNLVHVQPRALSLFLPAGLTLAIGAGLLVFGVFISFASASVLRDAEGMLAGLVQAYVGVWLMLAPSAGQRGSWADQQLVRRLFAMLILLDAVVVASFYLGDPRFIACLSLLLIAAGIYVASNQLRAHDRGR
jgi:hypothetical protein